MALIDVVKWESTLKEFCYKFPSDDLRIGSQLVVYPSQTAFFVKGGQICDEFTSGTYTLKSENLPVLNKLINIPFGKESPFQAEVWFVNQIVRLDLKWGTQQPILLEDPKYHIIIPVRSFGQYGIRVSNPRLFLETLIGNMNVFTVESIDSYFKGKMISFLSSTISQKITLDQISVLDINSHLMDFSKYCEKEIDVYFEQYGLSLADFSIMSINVPQDDPSFLKLKEAKAAAASLNVMGRDFYQMERSFDVLDKAASNLGTGTQVMGLGVGMGLGNVLSGISGQNLNTNPQPTPPTQEPTFFLYVNGQQIGGKTVGQIVQMKEQGLINEDTLVWTPGMENWTELRNVPSLHNSCPPPIKPKA